MPPQKRITSHMLVMQPLPSNRMKIWMDKDCSLLCVGIFSYRLCFLLLSRCLAKVFRLQWPTSSETGSPRNLTIATDSKDIEVLYVSLTDYPSDFIFYYRPWILVKKIECLGGHSKQRRGKAQHAPCKLA